MLVGTGVQVQEYMHILPLPPPRNIYENCII